MWTANRVGTRWQLAASSNFAVVDLEATFAGSQNKGTTNTSFDSDTWSHILSDVGRVPVSADHMSPTKDQSTVALNTAASAHSDFNNAADALRRHPQFLLLKRSAEEYLRVTTQKTPQWDNQRSFCAVARTIVNLDHANPFETPVADSERAELDHFVLSTTAHFQRLVELYKDRLEADQRDWCRLRSNLQNDLDSIVNSADSGSKYKSPGSSKASSAGSNTKRREPLSPTAINKLRDWLTKHAAEPYPDEDQKDNLSMETGLTVTQINNWFINARRRILPKMLQVK